MRIFFGCLFKEIQTKILWQYLFNKEVHLLRDFQIVNFLLNAQLIGNWTSFIIRLVILNGFFCSMHSALHALQININ